MVVCLTAGMVIGSLSVGRRCIALATNPPTDLVFRTGASHQEQSGITRVSFCASLGRELQLSSDEVVRIYRAITQLHKSSQGQLPLHDRRHLGP